MSGTVLHRVQGSAAADRKLMVTRNALVNQLNYLHFKGDTILLNLEHPRLRHQLTLPAFPQPSLGVTLDCFWAEDAELPESLSTFKLRNVLIADAKQLLLVRPQLVHLDHSRISLALPDTCSTIQLRACRRFTSTGIGVELMQDGVQFKGRLKNFSSNAFQVVLTPEPPLTGAWINREASVLLVLKNAEQTCYSGTCGVIDSAGARDDELVLVPKGKRIQRFKPKNYRSQREVLQPSPTAVFRHPLSGRQVDLPVHDLSGSGFSLREPEDEAQLLPGLLLPDLQLNFADGNRFSCCAQVMHQQHFSENGRTLLLAGVAILDMDLAEHGRLMAALQQAWDRNACLDQRIDPARIWEFFFASGLVSSRKYVQVLPRKQEILQTVGKLYTETPKFFRHFVYRENGRILGHLGLLKLYSRSWLLHHHAALRTEAKRAGVMVLRQFGRAINASQNLCSTQMDYVITYFQPQNRFASRFYGGLADYYQDRKSCSLDRSAYFHVEQECDQPWNLQPPWSLPRTQPEDLQELQTVYARVSGGLMLKALDLTRDVASEDPLRQQYQRHGFKRERHLYSLKKAGELKAVIQVNLTEPGLDFSGLASAFTVMVLDPDDLPAANLKPALALLAIKFELERPAVLLYPAEYADNHGLDYEKNYQLWVLNCRNLDPYFEFSEKLFTSL